MKVYIAGKMSGVHLHNFPAFDEAAARLRGLGHEVVSPAELDRAAGFDGTSDDVRPGSEQYCAFLRRSLLALLNCDAIAMLPGWHDSRGAVLEFDVARMVGMQVVTMPTMGILPS